MPASNETDKKEAAVRIKCVVEYSFNPLRVHDREQSKCVSQEIRLINRAGEEPENGIMHGRTGRRWVEKRGPELLYIILILEEGRLIRDRVGLQQTRQLDRRLSLNFVSNLSFLLLRSGLCSTHRHIV
jgi:hypothetical protein